jgi:hypothetical protein
MKASLLHIRDGLSTLQMHGDLEMSKRQLQSVDSWDVPNKNS